MTQTLSEPDASMMAPIGRLARFMAGGPEDLATIYASAGVIILDNHPPFAFVGVDAVETWARRLFESHPGYVDLVHQFGPAQDFQHLDERVYFSLPTTWTWRRAKRAFHETGGWAFVLRIENDAWRVESHGWAVTSYTVLPPNVV